MLKSATLGASSQKELHTLLAATEVGEVWGVGRKISAHLFLPDADLSRGADFD